MTYPIVPETCTMLFADDYIAANRKRGGRFSAGELGLSFVGLSNCLCLGKDWQVVMPIEADNRPVYIFKDCCPYVLHEAKLPGIAAAHSKNEVIEIGEAAPFFPPGSSNFWHWLTESLPKILFLEQSGYTGSYIISASSTVAINCLEMLGISKERILFAGPTYKADRLIIPSRLNGFSLASNIPLSAYLRSGLIDAAGKEEGRRNIYVRRTGRRVVKNEADLLKLLGNYDFETIVPEELAFKEQFRSMTNAACSVMAHGANSALSLMQPPGSTFVEFFSWRYISYTNMHAVRLLKLKYHSLVEEVDSSVCREPELPARELLASGLEADIYVDLEHLNILLEIALSEAG